MTDRLKPIVQKLRADLEAEPRLRPGAESKKYKRAQDWEQPQAPPIAISRLRMARGNLGKLDETWDEWGMLQRITHIRAEMTRIEDEIWQMIDERPA